MITEPQKIASNPYFYSVKWPWPNYWLWLGPVIDFENGQTWPNYWLHSIYIYISLSLSLSVLPFLALPFLFSLPLSLSLFFSVSLSLPQCLSISRFLSITLTLSVSLSKIAEILCLAASHTHIDHFSTQVLSALRRCYGLAANTALKIRASALSFNFGLSGGNSSKDTRINHWLVTTYMTANMWPLDDGHKNDQQKAPRLFLKIFTLARYRFLGVSVSDLCIFLLPFRDKNIT